MIACQKHRAPDESGTYRDQDFELGKDRGGWHVVGSERPP